MSTKKLLLIGILSLALAVIVKTAINELEAFDEDDEFDGHDEEYGFPLFI